MKKQNDGQCAAYATLQLIDNADAILFCDDYIFYRKINILKQKPYDLYKSAFIAVCATEPLAHLDWAVPN